MMWLMVSSALGSLNTMAAIFARSGRSITPFSVTMAVMSSAGVTSKAGCRIFTPSGAQRTPR